MRLPKELSSEGVEPAVLASLKQEVVELCAGSKASMPVLRLTPGLRKHIFIAKAVGELIFGFEAIEESLANELKGLRNADILSDRVSRLLLVTNDGSPRFYRQLEFLQDKQGGRVLICRLDIDSLLMGKVLGLKAQAVKAVLLNRKKSVLNVLRSLIT